MEVIKKLKGHSGSEVLLCKKNNYYFIRKIGNVERNYERLNVLSQVLNVPEIYQYENDILDMEYIHGQDISSYLLYNKSTNLIDYILETLKSLSVSYEDNDYQKVYNVKLSDINYSKFNFTYDQLFKKLPKKLNRTLYHGDFTLDNIIFNHKNNKFYLIDPMTTVYDSYVFDIAKLDQDLTCQWFNRKSKINFDSKLKNIHDQICKAYEFLDNKYLTIAMLLRVYPYCKTDYDKNFIENNVRMLWK